MLNLFKMEIELGNDLMQTSYDLANALEEVARSIRHKCYVENNSNEVVEKIMDDNGNTVGGWKLL